MTLPLIEAYKVDMQIELTREIKLKDLYEIIKSVNTICCSVDKDMIYCEHTKLADFVILFFKNKILIHYTIFRFSKIEYNIRNIEMIKLARNVIQTLRKLGLIKTLKIITKLDGRTIVRTIQYCK